MDAWLFWKSLSIGLAVAAPVGPMSLLCIHRTLDHGQGAGLVFGTGVAAADLTYAAIAAFGVTAVSSALLASTFWIKLVGSVLLVMLGVRIALATPQPDGRTSPTGSGGRAFFTAYGLTMANPPTILFFAGIFASVASIASTAQSVTFAAGVFAGSMLWWVILTTLVSKSAALFRPPVLIWINRFSGAVLVGFAIYGFATLA
ncbi:MAG: LysE family transporter [Betaproteobacteria bacterium]|nr:LysE family transporter [Betaproteobacteria bacterium]